MSAQNGANARELALVYLHIRNAVFQIGKIRAGNEVVEFHNWQSLFLCQIHEIDSELLKVKACQSPALPLPTNCNRL